MLALPVFAAGSRSQVPVPGNTGRLGTGTPCVHISQPRLVHYALSHYAVSRHIGITGDWRRREAATVGRRSTEARLGLARTPTIAWPYGAVGADARARAREQARARTSTRASTHARTGSPQPRPRHLSAHSLLSLSPSLSLSLSLSLPLCPSLPPSLPPSSSPLLPRLLASSLPLSLSTHTHTHHRAISPA